jgi:hypothetical protein
MWLLLGRGGAAGSSLVYRGVGDPGVWEWGNSCYVGVKGVGWGWNSFRALAAAIKVD